MYKKLFLFVFFTAICSFRFTECQQDNVIKYKSIWQKYATKTITDINEYNISFDDGSEWVVGYWWKTELDNWEIGNIVQISVPEDLAYYFFRIYNLTKNQIVWSTGIVTEPSPYFPKCLCAEEIKKNEKGYSIKTNSRFTLEITKYCENWQPGDNFTILESAWPDGKPALLHHKSGIIIGASAISIKEQLF